MYHPQEPVFRFNFFYAAFDVSKILWFSILFTKQFFRYYEQQVLSRIFFPCLEFSFSLKAPIIWEIGRKGSYAVLHLWAFVKNRSLMSLLFAENAGKCPLEIEHCLVKAHSTEGSLFSGRHSQPKCCQCSVS